MMFASARMDAGQSNIVSRKQYMSCFVGVFQQALFDSARICVGHEHFI